MPEHVHVHAPHELSHAEHSEQTHERWLEFFAALLLSIATIAVAWNGYQAARWSGLQSQHYTEASAARSLANRASTIASRQQLQDLLLFDSWLQATAAGDMFFAGMSLRFHWTAMRIAVLALSGLLMMYGLARLATLPVR